MELRSRLARAAAATAAAVCALVLAPTAGASPPAAQAGTARAHQLAPAQATRIADRAAAVERARRSHAILSARPRAVSRRRWEVGYFAGGRELVQVVVDDRRRTVKEVWTGHQVRWTMARGYEGAFGRKVNAPWIWIPLCVLFLVPFIDPRRPFRLLHLDLLVMLAFGASHLFFNRGEIGVSVPLVYPVLLYLLGRMLVVGLRPRERHERLVPLVPVAWLALAVVFLVGFRVALNVTDSEVIDVGYASVVGADRIADGKELYGGGWPRGVSRGDTYGPVAYLAYLPFEQALPWSGRWDDLPAAHAAAIAFDLLTLLGLLLLGRRLRPGAEGRMLGVALAYAWATYPYALFVLESNANDSLVALLVVAALLCLTSASGRGAMAGLAAGAKFAPLALAPLLAAGTGQRRARTVLIFAAAAVAVMAATTVPFLPDGGPRQLFDRTVGFQLSRDSPFSAWGLEPSLAPVQTVIKAGAAVLAAGVFLAPRRRSPAAVAALGAAVTIALQITTTHWFYLYVVWFAPLVLVALFALHRDPDPPPETEAPAGHIGERQPAHPPLPVPA